MFVFDVVAKVGCVVCFIHEEYPSDKVGDKGGWLNGIPRRHQHIIIHGSEISNSQKRERQYRLMIASMRFPRACIVGLLITIPHNFIAYAKL